MSKYLAIENIKKAEVGDKFWFHLKIDPVDSFPAINRDVTVRLIKKDNGIALFDQTNILFLLDNSLLFNNEKKLIEYVETRISQAIPLENKAFILDMEQYLKLPPDWATKYYQQQPHNFFLSRKNSLAVNSLVLNDFPVYAFDGVYGLSFSFYVNYKAMKYNLE